MFGIVNCYYGIRRDKPFTYIIKSKLTHQHHPKQDQYHRFCTMASEAKIYVKFFADKDENRVVFAEANKDFLDTLFSFLTLPLSTVIELINDSSVLESMTNIYKSVKSLDDKHLQTEACKNMLLRPLCEDLKLNIGDANPIRFYHCSENDCMNSWWKREEDSGRKREEDSGRDGGGVVKGGEPTFIIMDDLSVTPASVASTATLLQKLGIKNKNKLEERHLFLGKNEISYLLKRSIISGTPLSDICFHKAEVFPNESRNAYTSNKMSIKTEGQTEGQSESEPFQQIRMKLYIDRDYNRMLCAEVDREMVNLVFGFLVLPMGRVIKLLNISSSMGCLDNLYCSVQSLGFNYVPIECQSLLLSPQLPPFFSCSKNLLNLDELQPRRQLITLDTGRKVSGGYVYGQAKYILTDNLCVSPLTPSSILQTISDCEGTFSKILEKEVVIGKAQALELLKAALISKTPLTDVFLSRA